MENLTDRIETTKMGESSSPPQSIRLSLLNRILPYISGFGMHIPPSVTVSHMEIPEFLNTHDWDTWLETKGEWLAEETRDYGKNLIFADPCPLDEYYYPHLSFAGVYTSYKPLRGLSRRENIIDGLVKMIQDRNSYYADYYYSRHDIRSERTIDIMFAASVNTCMFGTAYIYDDRCLLEYCDSPLSISLGDPKRLALDYNSKLTDLELRLRKGLFALYEFNGRPLDIEFLVDDQERIFINELRPISEAHIRNWKMLEKSTWLKICAASPPANILNSIGEISGKIIDLRQRKPRFGDFQDPEDKIYLIRHQDTQSGTSSFEFLNYLNNYKLSGIRLLVDHGRNRKNNHLQYILFEDPGITFLVNTTGLARELNEVKVSLSSDGFNVTIKSIKN